MESRIAPTLAIVFMDSLEKQFLTDLGVMQRDAYMRYIDDVFAVWTHGKDSLSEYLNFLNTKHETI